MFNRCEGLPFSACPDSRRDKTVKNTIYDLFLCPSCERTRDAERANATGQATGISSELKEASNKKALKQQSKKTTGSKADGSSSSNPVVEVVASQTASSHGTPSKGRLRNASLESRSTVDKTVMGVIENSGIAIITGSSFDFGVNELLSYISFYRNKSNAASLRQTVLSFYIPNDISHAKQILIQKYSLQLESCPLLAERRNSSARSVHEAELDDIIGMFDILDSKNALNAVTFVSANLDNLPKFGPEEFNLVVVVNKQVRAEAAIKDQSVAIEQLKTSQAGSFVHEAVDMSTTSCREIVKTLAADLLMKIDSVSSSINARLDQLSSVYKSSLGAAQTRDSTSPSLGAHVTADRKQNIVIFGVKEDQDPAIWRQRVETILEFVHGTRVDFVDMFRLGRFNSDKTRPVLVKLRTIWDKRIILNGCSRLKQFSQRGVFISADEPPEVRRKHTFDRLKRRADQDKKLVNVTDGVLSIDGVAVFSLSSGSINASHG